MASSNPEIVSIKYQISNFWCVNTCWGTRTSSSSLSWSSCWTRRWGWGWARSTGTRGLPGSRPCLLPQTFAPNTFERVRKKSLYIQLSASEGSVWARRKETFERVGRKRLSASERAQAQARERRGHTTPPGHGGWSQLFLGFLPIDISTAGDIPSQDDGWGQEVHQDLNLPSREGLKVRRDLPKRTVDLTTVNLWMRKHGILLPTKRPKRKIFQYQFFIHL